MIPTLYFFSTISMLAGIKTIFSRTFDRSKLLPVLIILALLHNIAHWVVLILFIQPREEPIILHYNIYFGPDLIGDWYRIFLLPLSGSLIWSMNTLLPFFLKKNHQTMSYFLTVSNLVSQLILGLASILLLVQNL